MASHESSDIAARADALVCQGAVRLLRARRKAGVAGEDLAPDVDRLLSAVSLELETDPESIPAAMRRAVVQLAEHLVQRASIPVPREGQRPDRRQTTGADHVSDVPYGPSIRLGRMG